MRHVTESLEALGYRWAYRVVDTRAFGLPQRRERVILLASKVADPACLLFAGREEIREPLEHVRRPCGFYWTEGLRGLGWAVDSVPTLKGGSTIGIASPPAIWTMDGSFVTPDIRDAERLQGFSPDWTEPASTVGRPGYRWKLIGNAVSVPVAEWVGQRLAAEPGSRPVLATVFNDKATWPRAAFSDRGRRLAVNTTSFPVVVDGPGIEDFLSFPTRPLSERALAGFWSRLVRSSLSTPEEFDSDIQRALGHSTLIDRGVRRKAPSREAKRASAAVGSTGSLWN